MALGLDPSWGDLSGVFTHHPLKLVAAPTMVLQQILLDIDTATTMFEFHGFFFLVIIYSMLTSYTYESKCSWLVSTLLKFTLP